MRNNRSNRSLLGIPDRNDSAARFAQIQDEQLLEKDNDNGLDELHQKVKFIKQISKDIEVGIKSGTESLDHLVRIFMHSKRNFVVSCNIIRICNNSSHIVQDTEMGGAQAL